MTRQDRSLWVVLVSPWRVSLCVSINFAKDDCTNSDVSSLAQVTRSSDSCLHPLFPTHGTTCQYIEQRQFEMYAKAHLIWRLMVIQNLCHKVRHFLNDVLWIASGKSATNKADILRAVFLYAALAQIVHRRRVGTQVREELAPQCGKQFDSSVSWLQHQFCRKAQALHAIMWIFYE